MSVSRMKELCPGCGHKLQATKPEWMGLPAGVKFDPTDQELMEHLEAKVKGKDEQTKSHPLIDDFIPTILGDDGICYTHPHKLPGVRRDGLSRHFFHRQSKAYTTGTRKRRKIQNDSGEESGAGETRWHKTGKTRPVMVKGRQKGCKKILVLYTNFGKNRRPEKTNWVMHQYHLGVDEEERDGELVVSKIFYQTQPRQCSWSDHNDLDHHNRMILGSCSTTSKEFAFDHHSHAGDEISGVAAALQSLGSVDFSRAMPFRKHLDQGRAEGSVCIGGSSSSSSHHHYHHHDMSHDRYHQEHHQMGDTRSALHIPSSSSTSPHPTIPSIMSSLVNVDEHSFSIPRIMLPNVSFEDCDSGLEEVIMGCTSATHIKHENSVANPQDEAEWSKYSFFSFEPHRL